MQLSQWLRENEHADGTIEVDSAIYVKDTWSKQLLDAVAVDHSIEDTLYELDRSLQDDRIECDQFLKVVRKRARDQFMARALQIKIMNKQQQQAGHRGGL